MPPLLSISQKFHYLLSFLAFIITGVLVVVVIILHKDNHNFDNKVRMPLLLRNVAKVLPIIHNFSHFILYSLQIPSRKITVVIVWARARGRRFTPCTLNTQRAREWGEGERRLPLWRMRPVGVSTAANKSVKYFPTIKTSSSSKSSGWGVRNSNCLENAINNI